MKTYRYHIRLTVMIMLAAQVQPSQITTIPSKLKHFR